MREIRLPGFDKVILSDTVGFVSDLPTQLVAAFRATLEEVASADLLIHVRDMSHPDRDAQRDDVDEVLASLGVAGEKGPPRIEAWNKVDNLTAEDREALFGEAARREDVVPISALTGEGIDALREAAAGQLRAGAQLHHVRLSVSDGSRLAWLHARGDVVDQRVGEAEIELDVRLSPDNWEKFQALQPA